MFKKYIDSKSNNGKSVLARLGVPGCSLLGLLLVAGCSGSPRQEAAPPATAPGHTPAKPGAAAVAPATTAAPAPDSRISSVAGLAFGFSDSLGRHLLALEELAAPGSFTSTVSARGQVLPIRFVKTSQPTDRNSNRQTEQNFYHLGGLL